MLASNNILKPSDGRPVATPTQDMIIGLFHLTADLEGSEGEGRAFTSMGEAQMAYDLGGLNLGAKVRIRIGSELKETTFGRALFNETLPEAYPYVEMQVGKKQLGQIVSDMVEMFSRTQVAQSLDMLKDAGFYWATRSGVSMAISDANFDPKGTFDKERASRIAKAEKAHTKIQEAFDNGLKSDLERRDELGALWFKETGEIEQLLRESIPKDNTIYKMVTSGARGNWLQIRSIMGMRGPVATSSGDFAPMPVKGNYLLGLTPHEYFINATGARKGNADTAMKTAAAGYLTRRLVDVAQDVIIQIDDCGTNRGLDKDLLDEDQVELSIVGRTNLIDIKDGKNIIHKAGENLDHAAVRRIKQAGHETITVRSVLTCEAEAGICVACYGVSLATNQKVTVGEAIGIIAAQSIGEPGTQLTMRTFHTGGAASSAKKQTILKSIGGQKVRVERLISYDITQGLNGVTDLLEARVGWRQAGKVAVMAFWNGQVDIVEKVSLTGAKSYEVYVRPQGEAAEKEAESLALQYSFSRTASKTFKKLSPFLPITTVSSLGDLVVEKGDSVEAGDYLVDGTPIPHEVLMIKGAREAAAEIIRGVQAIYGSQGVPLHDKHLEVIVRQMLNKVTVIDSGDTEMLPGEVIDRQRFAVKNRAAVAQGLRPASARQEVMGMTRASLAAQSWLSAASFQETTRVLTQAALDKREDRLVGLKENVIIGKLIPAGTGLSTYRNFEVDGTEEAKAERYPNRIWSDAAFDATDLESQELSLSLADPFAIDEN
jgi:DNA-directed RNA polymerase subunit beta'